MVFLVFLGVGTGFVQRGWVVLGFGGMGIGNKWFLSVQIGTRDNEVGIFMWLGLVLPVSL